VHRFCTERTVFAPGGWLAWRLRLVSFSLIGGAGVVKTLTPVSAPSTTKDHDMDPTLAVGYLRQYRSMTCDQLARAHEQLAAFADREGVVLCKVFVEHLRTDPAAFDALIRSVKRRGIAAVIVPTEAHLSAVGSDQTKLERLHRETSARAMAADGSIPI
jgi:hypothetical protein